MAFSLSSIETAYIKTQNLLPLLREYTNLWAWIGRMVKKGELIRLKNGFFLIAEKIRKEPVPFEQIANLLHGPSYISFERALSFYGMIPEGVYVITSVCSIRSKKFRTPMGDFHYTHLNHRCYSIGIDQKENFAGRFLIATPEKALADLVHQKNKKLGKKDMLIDLIEGRRIDEEILRNLNKKHLLEISERYSSQAVNQLVNAIGLL